MADATKSLITLGMVGVGGYVIYEYMQYNHAISVINSMDTTGATGNGVQNALPFMSYLTANFSTPTGVAAQALALIQSALAGTLAPSASGAPGTTGSGQTTSVSTAPPSTNTNTSSTGGSTAPNPPPPTTTPQPTAADLQAHAQISLGSADQWNYSYRQMTGYGIEQIYGGNFDAIYGTIGANGQRSTGNITAQAFLSLPAAKGLTQTALSGFGAIARFYTPVVNPMASLVYRAQHPSPYRLPVSGGMGALTQATGFEKALWAGGFIRSRRVR